MIYLELFRALERQNIQYVVVGGLAVIFHGFARMSMDLDLAVSLESQNLRQFVDLAEHLGYRPKLPVSFRDLLDKNKRKEWAEQKHMLVFSLYHQERPQELVDVFIHDLIPFHELFKRHVRIPLGEDIVRVASIEDLKTMKRMAGRPQDLQDIAALENLEKKKLT